VAGSFQRDDYSRNFSPMECVSNRRFAKQQFFERECLNWVKMRRTRIEHMSSGLPSKPTLLGSLGTAEKCQEETLPPFSLLPIVDEDDPITPAAPPCAGRLQTGRGLQVP